MDTNNNTGRKTSTFVSGASQWINRGALTIGSGGDGTLSILSGGTVRSGSTVIADKDKSVGAVNVSGVGSTLTNSGDLTVGNFGSGGLTITNGSTVSNAGTGTLGDKTDSYGLVSVSGAGSTLTNDGAQHSLAIKF